MHYVVVFCILLISKGTGAAATLETVKLASQIVYFEEAVETNDIDLRYWLRNSAGFLRFTSNSIQIQPEFGPISSIRFAEANPASTGSEPVGFRIHRYSGEAANWRRDVRGWRVVEYGNAYPGIDVSFRAESGLALRLRVRPGAVAGAFGLVGDGSRSNPLGLAAPTAWQEIGGSRVPVAVRIVLDSGGTLRFEAGTYDRTQPLWIESVSAGAVERWASARPIATDANGNIFLTGTAQAFASCGFTTGGTRIPCTDVWVAGFRPNGDAMFFTRFEGSLEDSATDLRWRAPGELVVVGNTASPNFPVTANAYQKQNAGPLGPVPRTQLGVSGDLFLARIDSSSGELIYSTYYGGPGQGESGMLALTPGRVSVFLENASRTLRFPVSSWLSEPTCGAVPTCRNGALVRFNAELTQLERGTFLPLVNYTVVEGHSDGSVYLTGSAYDAGESSAVGTPGTLQPQRQGRTDAYLLRLNPEFSSPVFATMYGGNTDDSGDAVLVNTAGQASVLGTNNLATGATHQFFVQFSADGSRVISQRDLSASKATYTTALATSDGGVILAGNTLFATLLTTNDAPLAGGCSSGAGYLSILAPDGNTRFATYLKGASVVAKSLVVNRAGQLLLLEQGAEGVSRIDLTAASQAALQCVTGAASRIVGAGLSPGKIVTLLGRGIGPKAGRSAELTRDLRFPLSLDGVQVKVNGVPAPLLYVQDSQINAIVPYEGVTPRSAAKVEVEYEGKTLSVETPSAFTGVELFTNDFSGRGQAVAVHENGSLNSPDNAIAAGSIIVLYGTGVGVTAPASSTGALAPILGAGALAQPIGPVVAFIGGRQAEVLYAGAAPGLVNGAAQFNVRVPIGVSGNVNVDIRINGSLPGNLATIAVR